VISRFVQGAAAVVVVMFASIVPAAGADQNAGAVLVQTNGCAGCHGTALRGGIGPSLIGIERRRSPAQITAAIVRPTAPMPTFPFSATQVADIVAYLSSLDATSGGPVATIQFDPSGRRATLSVHFPGTAPMRVRARPVMRMGNSSMDGGLIALQPSSDRHLWRGSILFSMSGPWTIEVVYDGHHLAVPVNIAGNS
jgi:hypothetical protein